MPAAPLAVLVAWLQRRAAPPDLQALQEVLLQPESLAEFRRLVREYLPDQEAEILAQRGAGARVTAFAHAFGEQYFPLGWAFDDGNDSDSGYGFLVSGIYGQLLGWDDEDWHELADRPDGYVLLYALGGRCGEAACPDLAPMHGGWEEEQEGRRVTAVAYCAERLVDEALLRRLPEGGYTRTELHRLLDGTEYQAAADAADWFRNDTDNGFLDYSDGMELNVHDDWSQENVRGLTDIWARAEALTNRVQALGQWLEQDMNRHFSQLLDFIAYRKGEDAYDARQLRLLDPGPRPSGPGADPALGGAGGPGRAPGPAGAALGPLSRDGPAQ